MKRTGRLYVLMLATMAALPLVLVLLTLSSGPTEAQVPKRTVKIGALFPQTGSMAFGAANAIQG